MRASVHSEKTASDPIPALTLRETVNHWPTSLVFSIHLYHMLFFNNLYFIDWLHHILMVVIGAPLLIVGEMGHLMNFNHFFMCGVPGGADYAMLFFVKVRLIMRAGLGRFSPALHFKASQSLAFHASSPFRRACPVCPHFATTRILSLTSLRPSEFVRSSMGG